MQKRINISLPEETLRLIDRVAPNGNRSRFLDALVKEHVGRKGRQSLRRQLEAGYARWREADRELAQEWFHLEEEAWPKPEK